MRKVSTFDRQNPKKLLIFWISFQKNCYFFGKQIINLIASHVCFLL